MKTSGEECTDLSVIDGVKIWHEGNVTHFIAVDDPKPQPTIDTRSWFQKLCDWWNDADVKPYAKIRDLSDPIGKRKEDPFDDGSGTKKGIEIGIKVSF